MPIPDFSEFIKIIREKNNLRILFYLREFNPNVSVNDLCTNLKIEEKEVIDRLNNLEKMKIVINVSGLYQLTQDGRKMVNSFYHNLGEPIPQDN